MLLAGFQFYAASCSMLRQGAAAMAASKNNRLTSRLSVTVNRADWEFLERLAEAQDRSMSWVAARAIHLFVINARRSAESPSASGPSNDR
jgi:hypothetical protein